jgi:hypothetical protein
MLRRIVWCKFTDVSNVLSAIALMMDAASSSETSANLHLTWQHLGRIVAALRTCNLSSRIVRWDHFKMAPPNPKAKQMSVSDQHADSISAGKQTAFLQNTVQPLRPQFRTNLDFIPGFYPALCRQATCHGQTIYDSVTVLISIAKATVFNYLSMDCATTGSSHYPTRILTSCSGTGAETVAHCPYGGT